MMGKKLIDRNWRTHLGCISAQGISRMAGIQRKLLRRYHKDLHDGHDHLLRGIQENAREIMHYLKELDDINSQLSKNDGQTDAELDEMLVAMAEEVGEE